MRQHMPSLHMHADPLLHMYPDAHMHRLLLGTCTHTHDVQKNVFTCKMHIRQQLEKGPHLQGRLFFRKGRSTPPESAALGASPSTTPSARRTPAKSGGATSGPFPASASSPCVSHIEKTQWRSTYKPNPGLSASGAAGAWLLIAVRGDRSVAGGLGGAGPCLVLPEVAAGFGRVALPASAGVPAGVSFVLGKLQERRERQPHAFTMICISYCPLLLL
jgi:hypothetical protein